MNAALSDTVFLMRLEHDSDVVPMESYAPLLVNVNTGASQWGTNLIGYDALHSFGSPSYYAQAMLGQNKGDVVLPTTLQAAPPAAAPAAAPHGSAGVGSYHTQVQYKDITVTAPDGQTLLTADLTKDTHDWRSPGGAWNLQDRTFASECAEGETWAMTGDPSWTDYTIRLKARKQSGPEGFLVLFHAQDGSNYRWWNVGGWGNTRPLRGDAGRRPGAYGPSVPFTVETGRWYDLRLEVTGNHVRGFVDGKLVTDTNGGAGRRPRRCSPRRPMPRPATRSS